MVKKIFALLLSVFLILNIIPVCAENGILYSLNFELPYTIDSKSNWETVVDSDGNRCIQNKYMGGMSGLFRLGDSTLSNYYIKFKARTSQTKNDGAMHFNFYENGNQNNCLRMIVYHNKNVTIRNVTNGSYGDTALISTNIESFMTNFIDFEIRVFNGTVNLYIGNKFVGSNLFKGYSGGTMSWAAWNMQVQLDDIEVGKIDKLVPVQRVYLRKKNYSLNIGDREKIKYFIIPSNSTVKDVQLITQKSDIVVFNDDEYIRAVGNGNTTFRVRSVDGQKVAYGNVSVTSPVIADVTDDHLNYDIKVCVARDIIPLNNSYFHADSKVTCKDALSWLNKIYSCNTDNSDNTYITQSQLCDMSNKVFYKYLGINYNNEISIFPESFYDNKICTKRDAAKILRYLSDKIKYGDFKVDNTFLYINRDINDRIYKKGEGINVFVRSSKGSYDLIFENLENKDKNIVPFTGNFVHSFTPELYGTYNLLIKDDSAKYLFKPIGLGVMINNSEKIQLGAPYFGVQTQLSFTFSRNEGWDHNYNGMNQYETLDNTLHQLEWMGVNLIRDGGAYFKNKTESFKPCREWNWDFMDLLMKRTREKNITVNTSVGNYGSEIKEEYRDSTSSFETLPRSDKSIEEFLLEFMRRYSDYPNLIAEVMNEPNFLSYFSGTVEEYSHILQLTANIIKGRSPGMKVTSGGVVVNGNNGDDAVLYSTISNLLSENKLDYYAFHSYGGLKNLEQAYATVKQKAKSKGGEIEGITLLNETGYESSDKIRQSEEMMKKLIYAYGNNVQGVVYFLCRTLPELAISGGRSGYALFGNSGEPRSVAVAYSNLINKLSGKHCIDFFVKDNIYAYVFSDGKESCAVCFSDTGNVHVNLNVNASVFDMYGNKAENSPILSSAPVYLVSDKVITKDNLTVIGDLKYSIKDNILNVLQVKKLGKSKIIAAFYADGIIKKVCLSDSENLSSFIDQDIDYIKLMCWSDCKTLIPQIQPEVIYLK